MMAALRRIVARYPISAFFVLTFILSWAVWIPVAVCVAAVPIERLGTFAPLVAALALTGLLDGPGGLRALLRGLIVWRVRAVWYVFSLLSTAAIGLAALGIDVALGGTLPKLKWRQLLLFVPATVYVLLTSVLGEETGWRGFALPRLLRREGPFIASAVLGVALGVWHLPLFAIPGEFHRTIPVPLFLLQIVGLTFLYTWVYANTRGSLLLAHLFHAAGNATLGILPILPNAAGGRVRPLWIAVALLWVVVLLVVARSRVFRPWAV